MAARTTGSSKSKSSTPKKATSAKPARAATKPAPGSAAAKTAPDVVPDTTPTVIDEVVTRSGVRKKFAKPAIEAMIDVLAEAIAEGREVNLQPFGKIKHQRTKDTSNARITVAKIRQSKTAGPALDPADRADDDKSNETVAEPAE